MSKGAERLLKKMVSPNADIRITAKEAMKDPYWNETQIPAIASESSRSIVNLNLHTTIY